MNEREQSMTASCSTACCSCPATADTDFVPKAPSMEAIRRNVCSTVPLCVLRCSLHAVSLAVSLQVLQFLYEIVQFLLYVKPRQRAIARRKARMKKKLQAETESGRPHGTTTSSLSGGFQLNGLRYVSTMNSPKNMYSAQI